MGFGGLASIVIFSFRILVGHLIIDCNLHEYLDLLQITIKKNL
jgi:hypothetical protein